MCTHKHRYSILNERTRAKGFSGKLPRVRALRHTTNCWSCVVCACGRRQNRKVNQGSAAAVWVCTVKSRAVWMFQQRQNLRRNEEGLFVRNNPPHPTSRAIKHTIGFVTNRRRSICAARCSTKTITQMYDRTQLTHLNGNNTQHHTDEAHAQCHPLTKQHHVPPPPPS